MPDTNTPTLEEFRELDAAATYPAMIGAQLTEVGDGRAVVTLPFRDDLAQHNGFLHGSLIGFLADYACAWAAGSLVRPVVTSEYKLNLLAPGIGERFIGRGQVVKASKRQIVCRADIFAVQDGVEKLIAIASATIMRLEKRG